MEKAKRLAALLRDTAQSASNAIASNISGPVDLLSMGMRGIGLPVPENAFGPNRDVWMQAKFGAKQDWGLFEGKLGGEFTQFLKAKGFEAAKFKEYVPTKSGGEVGGMTTVLFNPDRATKIAEETTANILERNGQAIK